MGHVERQQLFQALGRLERAGFPLDRSLETLRDSAHGRYRSRLELMARAAARGTPVWRSGLVAGLFSPWESRLLKTASESGTLETVLFRLAGHHATRSRWQRRLRSRLALPLALLVLLVLITPLAALVGGRIDGEGYLLRTALPLAALGVLVLAVARLNRRYADRGLPAGLERVLLRLPGLGRLLRLRGQRDLLMTLALLLAAGRPAVEALREASGTLRNPVLRGAGMVAAAEVEAGITLGDALAGQRLLDGRQGLPLVSAGEAAGALDAMVEQYAEALNERLDSVDDSLAEWLPRLLYFGVLGLLAWGILVGVI